MATTADMWLAALKKMTQLDHAQTPDLRFCWCSAFQLCMTLCNPRDSSMPGILHYPLVWSFTIFWSLLKLMSSESVMLSTISSSVIPFSFCFQSFPASGSFPMSQCCIISGSQNIGAPAPASIFPMNIQGWFSLGLPGWSSLQAKGLARVFSNTMGQKHKFFSTQASLWSNSHIHTWLVEKPELGLDRPLLSK